MDCKVVWTEPAIDDLREIVARIAIDDPEAAQRVGFDIIHTVELLDRSPLLGVAYPRTGDGSHLNQHSTLNTIFSSGMRESDMARPG